MRNTDARGRFENRMLWVALVPLLLLLRPYQGLIQDARIYIGRGLADRDPLGIGRDLVFAADGQTGFTLLRPVIRSLLGVLSPTQVSVVLALVGSLVWLGAVVVLCRSLARGRTAWAAVVCVLAFSSTYGSFGMFAYGESIVTPRVFAEAAVIGALAGLVHGRRIVPLLLLAAAVALHPLMALPGVGVAALMLIWDDRRWLLLGGGGMAALLAAAALNLPVAGRLFQPMDAAWFAILKARSVYLFPSEWDVSVYVLMAARSAAVIVAASIAPPRLRALLCATLAVAIGGTLLTAIFGDRFPLVLVTQLQPWRALWLLVVLGNASVALAVLGLWRRGPAARLTLAVLVLAWLSTATPTLAIALAAAAVALRVADHRNMLSCISPRVDRIAVALALGAAALDVVMGSLALGVYLGAASDQGGEALYSHLLLPGVQRWPLVLGALALVLSSEGRDAETRPPTRLRGLAKGVVVTGLVGATLAGIGVWTGADRSEWRMIDTDAAAADLGRLIGPAPGSVLWVDDYNQAWFFTGRAAYFTSAQGGPILFSRTLAFMWHDRVTMLIREGLARQADLTPWITTDGRDKDLPVSRASVEAVCRAADHPVAIVAPGDYADAAPPGWPSGLWRPPAPVQYLSGDKSGLRWHKVESYTVIQCGAADGASSPMDDGRIAAGRGRD